MGAPSHARLAVTLILLAGGAVDPRGAHAALTVEVLRSVGGLPPHIVGLFEDPIGFQQAPAGTYYVFDRRGHTVFAVDAQKTAARKLIEIGQEQGRVIQPRGFDLSPSGAFVVADAPRGRERVQIFDSTGVRLGGFLLTAREHRTPDILIGPMVVNSVASIRYTGANLLISHPESGALFTEYWTAGFARRNIGRLRETGHEEDRPLHLALNAGIPVVDPTGGYFYVFLGGRPLFQKYDADGMLAYERHIEGAELDGYVAALPTQWPTRRTEEGELPFVAPIVRAAAADAAGRLWVSLTLPYTYVYDSAGDKIRTVQFRAAGVISPTSLFFTRAGRLLVTPGCYEFDPRTGQGALPLHIPAEPLGWFASPSWRAPRA